MDSKKRLNARYAIFTSPDDRAYHKAHENATDARLTQSRGIYE